ncbi:MAG: hypothetical protein ROO76_16570 [Terriglobia bacterium]|nr:hypothetical protein [Terriglobia bacterium]
MKRKHMFRFGNWAWAIVCLLSLTPLAAVAQRGEGPLVNEPPKNGLTPDEVIQKFAAKEKVFKEAREHYTWTQDLTVEDDGANGSGEFRQVSDILFDDQGNRIEHVTFAPQSTLKNITMSREDFEDLRHRLPFVLTSDEIPEYDIRYLGQQREDELNTYVFDVAPKKIEPKQRYFQGRIWVDDTDFQIVKTYGKNVPDIRKKNNENLFPNFTTYRELIDGKYWFPTYTSIDDTLHFSTGDVHIREIVKYTNYKRFGSNTKITYEGQEVQKNKNGQPEQNPQQQNPPPQKPQQ